MPVPWDRVPAGSPRQTALRAQFTHPSSIVIYALFIGGLALSLGPSTRVIGSLLCLSLFGTFAGLRWLLSRFYISYCENSLRADLADIGKHYCVSESEGTRDAQSSASCFWVVEAYSDETGYCEIVGTVGLGASIQLFFCSLLINTTDSSTKDDQNTAELRRMAVSPHHRRLGIGQLLAITLIAHARERGLASVFLTTTSYQAPAIRLYERMGWVVQRRTAVWSLLPTFELALVDMKLDLTRS
jgi:ribosomal protein S18 acetylase RimI-like enzyme